MAVFTKGDPLARWNHPNHLAGFLADVAELLSYRGTTESNCRNPGPVGPVLLTRYRKAARATSRAARRVWTPRGRQDFAAHWGRLTGDARTLTGRYQEPRHAFVELVTLTAVILVDQIVDLRLGRAKYLGSAQAWVTITEDDVSDLEIRWRIRDWLSLTDDVINIPPKPRLAAAAAWRVGARTIAFEIVVDAANAMVGQRGT